jgi:hypothetical protein
VFSFNNYFYRRRLEYTQGVDKRTDSRWGLSSWIFVGRLVPWNYHAETEGGVTGKHGLESFRDHSRG